MSVRNDVHILYLTRNGLTEPLGYSQVFLYVKNLSESWKITVVSFEKRDFENDGTITEEVFSELRNRGVSWNWYRYMPGKKLVWIPVAIFSILFSIIKFEICWKNQKKIIHCRSYPVCFLALINRLMGGSKFIFDMRGFWVDELVASGRVCERSPLYKMLMFLERKCIEKCEHIITLTNSAKALLKLRYREVDIDRKTTVIPTCVDLNRFRSNGSEARRPPVISIVGTILSGWSVNSLVSKIIPICFELLPDSQIEIVTFDPKQDVERMLLASNNRISMDRISIFSCSPANIPKTISQHFFSLLFYSGKGCSEVGRSPTRFAELMASGVPVLTNKQVGDMDYFIDRFDIGVAVDGHTNLEKSVEKIIEYANNEDTRERCRKLARENFSLSSAVSKINGIYYRC